MYDVRIDTKQMDQQLMRQLDTTAKKIRYLHSLGFDRTEISRILNVRYQQVRNELTRETKRKV